MSAPDESHANSVQDPELRASFVRLYRTRENHQWAEPASPPSDPPLPAKIIQFPLFPDSTRPVSNAMARSALFSCIQGKDRRFIKDVFLATVEGQDIPYGQNTRNRLDNRVYAPAITQASACLLLLNYP
jgi:hypothetical protein